MAEWVAAVQGQGRRVFVVGTVAVDPERAPKRYSVDCGRSAHPRRGFRCGTNGERTGGRTSAILDGVEVRRSDRGWRDRVPAPQASSCALRNVRGNRRMGAWTEIRP